MNTMSKVSVSYSNKQRYFIQESLNMKGVEQTLIEYLTRDIQVFHCVFNFIPLHIRR